MLLKGRQSLEYLDFSAQSGIPPGHLHLAQKSGLFKNFAMGKMIFRNVNAASSYVSALRNEAVYKQYMTTFII